eukprot:7942432-Alexandrium_andersonii.AAC.1
MEVIDRCFLNEGLVDGNGVDQWLATGQAVFSGTVYGNIRPMTHNFDFAATQQAVGSWFLCKGDREEVLVGQGFSWGAVRDSMSDNVLVQLRAACQLCHLILRNRAADF